jgi:hypothetical protein
VTCVVKCIALLCNERVHVEWQKKTSSWNNCTALPCSTISCLFLSFSFPFFSITIPHLFSLSYLLHSLCILYLTHCLLSLLSSGDNLWSTAMDWMPQFEHLDALKQLFPDRYCIMLQSPMRLWVIKSAVLELTHFLISYHLIYHCSLLSFPLYPLLSFSLLISFLTVLIVSSSTFTRFLQWSLCSSKNTVASGDDRYTDSDDKDDAKNAFVQILPYRLVGRRHC